MQGFLILRISEVVSLGLLIGILLAGDSSLRYNGVDIPRIGKT